MNKWKKLGVSALCGTLASVSAANAGEFGVKGHITATHATADDDEATGNPLGMSRDFNFYASGEDGLIDYTTDVNYDAPPITSRATILSSLKDICNTDNIKFVNLELWK